MPRSVNGGRNSTYDDEIDQFKFFLGVPSDMQVTLDRSMLKQFEVTDPKLNIIEKRLQKFVSRAWQLDSDDPPIDELSISGRQNLPSLLRRSWEPTRCRSRSAADDSHRVRASMPKRLKRLLWDESREIVSERFERDVLIFENVRENYAEVVLGRSKTGRGQVEDPRSSAQRSHKAILSALKRCT